MLSLICIVFGFYECIIYVINFNISNKSIFYIYICFNVIINSLLRNFIKYIIDSSGNDLDHICDYFDTRSLNLFIYAKYCWYNICIWTTKNSNNYTIPSYVRMNWIVTHSNHVFMLFDASNISKVIPISYI